MTEQVVEPLVVFGFQNAACARAVVADPTLSNIWIVEHDVNTLSQAKKICTSCAHLSDCFVYSLNNSVQGVWGGMTTSERRNYRKNRPVPVFEKI